jgi:hypothetical protein
MEEDPIQFSAGDTNLRRYVGNDPTNHADASGLADWIIDKVRAVITYRVRVYLDFEDTDKSKWDEDRKGTFSKAFVRLNERFFNEDQFVLVTRGDTMTVHTIQSRRGTPTLGLKKVTIPPGTIPREWKMRLEVIVTDSNYDYRIEVLANPSPGEGQPPPYWGPDDGAEGAYFGGTWFGADARLNEGSVWGHNRKQYPVGTQFGAVREFGRLLGLGAPGKPKEPSVYSNDAPSLMGGGMEFRADYYNKWREQLSDALRIPIAIQRTNIIIAR